MTNWTWLLFVLLTVLCWGSYGPALHSGQAGFTDTERLHKSLRSLLCVGGAYFLVAVLIPTILLGMKGQLAGFTSKGVTLSTLAGVLGALGAIGIIWAFKNGGKPIVVMPLVFAGAPIVNIIVATIQHPPEGGLASINWKLYLGGILAGVGAYLVLANKPE